MYILLEPFTALKTFKKLYTLTFLISPHRILIHDYSIYIIFEVWVTELENAHDVHIISIG